MFKYRLFTDSKLNDYAFKEIGEIEVNNPISTGDYVMMPESMYRVLQVIHRFKDQLLVDGFETRLIVEQVLKR